MYAYDNQKNPPAPMAPITVFPHPGVQHDPITILALADTGADCTCLPLNILRSLDLLPNYIIRVSGVVGSERVNLYLVDIEFHNQVFSSYRVLELPQDAQAILGRDIMNSFRLEFNGPSRYLSVR
jgi:Retroviral aspartyl protease